MDILSEYNDKKILIWGYGREGKSTEQFLKTHVKAKSIECFEGALADIDRENYDYIFKSPGIPMEENDPKFTSQTELFMRLFSGQVIGITGTKGKSTTSSLMYHVLKSLGKKTVLLGNIGLPCLDYYDEIDPETIVVFELSCHQLAHGFVSPHIAVILNIFEEHLDYYGTVEKYRAAKLNIARDQSGKDYLYIGENVPEPAGNAAVCRVCGTCPDYGLKILGAHNNLNAHFVYRIATEVLGLDADAVKTALKSFDGLPHRLQFLGTLDGVDFYDDSISTIPEAAVAALLAVKNAGSILIGGMDRGIDYSLLTGFIRKHAEFEYIFMYASGKRVFKQVEGLKNCHFAEELKGAVALARSITPKGKACLLSPAAASYGYFKNFEERGNAFKEYLGL